MKKLNLKDAKEIGNDLGINWNEVDINEKIKFKGCKRDR